MSYQRDLPTNEFTLDRSFILPIDDVRTAALVTSTINPAHSLGLRKANPGCQQLDLLFCAVSSPRQYN